MPPIETRTAGIIPAIDSPIHRLLNSRMPTSPATPSSGRTALGDAVVMEAITRLESEGPLDDRLELRQAFRSQPTRAGQVTERAWLLGERVGFTQALAQWRQAAKWMLIALALLMALLALGSARAIVGPERSINAVAAFVGLLGLHFVTLVLWLLGVLWSVWGHRSSAGGLSLGRLALSLAARLPVDRSPHALLLLRSATAVLQRARLWIWLTGALSHGIWVMAFALVLAALAFGFAFHAYALNWETTILSPTFFQRFVQITGALPAQLGFPVPDAAVVAQGGPSGQRQPSPLGLVVDGLCAGVGPVAACGAGAAELGVLARGCCTSGAPGYDRPRGAPPCRPAGRAGAAPAGVGPGSAHRCACTHCVARGRRARCAGFAGGGGLRTAA